MKIFFRLLALASVLAAVRACESDCQVGVCNEFTARYLPVVHKSLQLITEEIATEYLPASCRPRSPSLYFSAVLQTYNQTAPQSICQFVFKYFHGKCLTVKGVEPSGCPDPDCPIVCGTSGSLCRHYSTLTEMVHLDIAGLMETLLRQQAVVDNVAGRIERAVRACPQAKRTPLVQVRKTAKNKFGTFRQVIRVVCGVDLARCRWEKPMKTFILGFH